MMSIVSREGESTVGAGAIVVSITILRVNRLEQCEESIFQQLDNTQRSDFDTMDEPNHVFEVHHLISRLLILCFSRLHR